MSTQHHDLGRGSSARCPQCAAKVVSFTVRVDDLASVRQVARGEKLPPKLQLHPCSHGFANYDVVYDVTGPSGAERTVVVGITADRKDWL
jgi:hypothetical protein